MKRYTTRQDCLQDIIVDTKRLIAFHDACKLEYPLTVELQKFLSPRLDKKERDKNHSISRETGRFSSFTMAQLQDEIKTCQCCSLQQHGEQGISAEKLGPVKPELLIICDWEDSGETEASEFMGNESKELLTKMLAAIRLRWEDVCICPIVKCAPKSEEDPSETDVQSCLPFLMRQIELLKPKVICAMGKVSSQQLLKSNRQLFALRGKFSSLLLVLNSS